MKSTIVIAGGSGALGSALIKNFNSDQFEVVILSRKTHHALGNVKYVKWDALSLGSWIKELENAVLVINLVGKSVNCRYTEKNKKEIIDSRVNSTLAIGQAIAVAKNPPKIWINAGSAAIFGNSGDVIKTESDLTVGVGFSPSVCKAWEKAFFQSETPQTRKVFLRIGMVLQKDEGVIKPLKNIVRIGFGGKIGSGDQFLTWIHETDFLNLINFVIDREEIEGILHCASPNPASNKEFMKALRKSIGIPFGIPTPAFVLKAGAVVIGTEPELVLSGRKVVSEVLRNKGFEFKFPTIKEAMKDLF